ncbi:glucose-1-phosphate thymidylyltransferase [Candidatus Nitrosotalea okcheonensis]|uniref:Glucose-1-phosphate thymidylyltransferase n=1 Tax=Candidatus Nitrosotalea okcheonensis TaxID=1903276 RepID=A0A2H1FHP3_9ARCH|nr:glucose-1-phosphate thymidylyltransferase [Candidatus Nitrosotalea okcheonensis]SMH72289.1 Glucose-1-phosphate thymidylyltransferase [Candidatus Nitrosotalea okcheonensis]
MKGIILHGGHGTRLRPLTHAGPKQLLKIANKPMSQYAVEDLRDAGITDLGIIIGDVYPEKVKEFYGDGSKFGVKISYVYQDQPKGISHAIRLCKDFIKDDRFVVYLGDNILRKGLVEYKKKFELSNSDAMILLCKVDDPTRFGVAELDGNKITKIVEKPKNSLSDLAVIGIYFLTPHIFDIIDNLKPSWRGELEITDALDMLLARGKTIQYDIVTGWWKDTGTPEDILDANRLILDTVGKENQFELQNDSEVKGNIVLGKNSTISRDCLVTGPVIIGHNCNIGPAVKIGPYVSIGNNSVLKNCDIENSIIMDNCVINVPVSVISSIIASGSEIIENTLPKKYQFLLGERSKIKM